MSKEYMKWDLEKLQTRYETKMKDNANLQKELDELCKLKRNEIWDETEISNSLRNEIKVLENKCTFQTSKIIQLHVNHDYVECVGEWENRNCQSCHLNTTDGCTADVGTRIKIINCFNFKYDKLKGKYGQLDYVDLDYKDVALKMVRDIKVI